ncbi:MAG: TetR/AcrR family transcriptional regulator [Acidimicrobiia bacterium]|nr:TetR/AcrR family transcriptional regulator [Acidimicrobiia bacterium]
MSGRLPGPERKRQLLAVARQVLAKNGYHETTMSEIATAAGVTKPVLYQHYRSKRDLYRNVLEDVGARLESTVIQAAVDTSSPRERAEAGIRAYAEFVEDDLDGFRLLFSGANRQDPEWAALTSSVERSLARAIASLIDVPDIAPIRRQTMAYGVMGLAEAMMRYAKSGEAGHYPTDRLSADITKLLWAGLRGIEADDLAPAPTDESSP